MADLQTWSASLGVVARGGEVAGQAGRVGDVAVHDEVRHARGRQPGPGRPAGDRAGVSAHHEQRVLR